MNRHFDINASGHSIRCGLYCGDRHKIRRVILFGHGFGGHRDNKAAERFANRVLSKYKDVAVITFDWPCHGDDGKKKLLLEDCEAYIDQMIRYVKDTYRTEDIYVYATSFGGYLFLKYIAEHGNPFQRIALRCPAVNMFDALTWTILSPDDLKRLEKGKDVLAGFDRKIKISRQFIMDLKNADITALDYTDYAEDILILHGTKDEVIPYKTAYEFADRNIIEFIPVENADHRFMDPNRMDAAIQYILEFFRL